MSPDEPNPTPGATTTEPPTTAQKSAATVARNKEQRRSESLDHIRAQTADGTLVIRQMTEEQRVTASETARLTRERNASRTRSYQSPGS
jgi:hypothetical protein